MPYRVSLPRPALTPALSGCRLVAVACHDRNDAMSHHTAFPAAMPLLARARLALRPAALLALAAAGMVATPALAQGPAKTDPAKTVPDAGVARDIADAQERPDPQATYKIVFDVQTMADSSDAVSPGLQGIGALINTYTHYGVPLSHLQMTAVFHGRTIALVTRDETYHQRTGSATNPNAALLRELVAAGVHLVVCGQSALGQHYTPADYLPTVQTNVSATVTFLNLQTRGYVKITE
jgi:intracellular sulfur oxidation DsrE/DsrF family protein